MMKFPKRNSSSQKRAEETGPIEMWTYLVRTHRFFRRLSISCVVLAFTAVAAGAHARIEALNAPLAFYLGSEGQAVLAGNLERARLPQKIEVEYVSRRFLKLTLGFHSRTISSDLSEAWELMTPSLQKRVRIQFADYERERGESFVDYVEKQAIRTTLDMSSIEIYPHAEKAYSVTVKGISKVWPLSHTSGVSTPKETRFESQLTLLAVPRSVSVPNGLVVDTQATSFYAQATGAQAQEEMVNQ